MIQKVNLKENVNAIDGLFLYKKVGTLNNHMLNVLQAECNELVKCLLIEVEGTLNQDNTGGTYTG